MQCEQQVVEEKMIVAMEQDASSERVSQVEYLLAQWGYNPHIIVGEERTVIAAVGTGPDIESRLAILREVPGVATATRVSSPYKLCSREAHKSSTSFTVKRQGGTVTIGDGQFVVIAGPCSVESGDQIFSTAKSIAESGAAILRGGAFKPRSSPYAFQGLGEDGLKLLSEAGDEFGLPVITEVMRPAQVEIVCQYADILQIGARNMQNFDLLKEVGQARKPVFLKRGPNASITEFLMSAEYVLAGGNQQVILCERGLDYTKDKGEHTRNILDIQAVPVLQDKTHLPVFLDPAHSSGKRHLVSRIAKACVAIGANGIMVEVHPDPAKALSDGAQSLTPAQFADMMADLGPYLELWEEEHSKTVAASAA